ncbi:MULTISPECIES: TetR/AcrR family transcriptional regulator [Lactobacillaceae]|uniref:TetR/AcrR family transcriptional regulator n=1 Tax=Lactobacillaceae TaxID=33958 RepID=UPI00145648D4|nr:TetR/AcrR family transcriptional regulator [Lactobacillus sp. HBUAS51381]NLR09764.1 TetR/AcrR family transcriptional regulator [Lactobacillus sp. HBUAS51381]
MTEKKTRRRGSALTNAILAAAWTQLQERGYQALTIEGIAAAAETTKTVLYRRWPDKAHLVIAAFAKFGGFSGYVVPDTGTLRTDFLALMAQMAAFLDKLQSETFRGLLADRLQSLDLGTLLMQANQHEPNSGLQTIVQPLLDHAAARGEITHAQWPDRLVMLPGILLINEVITQQALPLAARHEIVDQILLPVFGVAPSQE